MDNYVSYMRRMIGNKPMFLVGSGVIVTDKDNGVLLIKRTDNGKWGLPGGSLELGESFEDAAVREVREETGIDVSALKLFRVFSGGRMHFIYPNGDEVYNAVCMFETSEFTGTPAADGIESGSVGFFRYGETPGELHPPDTIILNEYFAEKEKEVKG